MEFVEEQIVDFNDLILLSIQDIWYGFLKSNA